MDDVVGSMSRLMDSPWFFVVVGFFVLLVLASLLATRLMAHREAQREDPPKVEREVDPGPRGSESSDGRDADE